MKYAKGSVTCCAKWSFRLYSHLFWNFPGLWLACGASAAPWPGFTLSNYVPVDYITLHYTYMSLCTLLLVSSLWNN